MGLSPRLRGNLVGGDVAQLLRGSIPAPAGEPSSARRRCSMVAVYPRACGGTTCLTLAPWPGFGLSPRLRGNLLMPPASITAVRSIPAPAGEPVSQLGGETTSKVYPRACGGTGTDTCTESITAGLSPRLRGNRGQTQAWWRLDGSIPAPAGEPGPHEVYR